MSDPKLYVSDPRPSIQRLMQYWDCCDLPYLEQSPDCTEDDDSKDGDYNTVPLLSVILSSAAGLKISTYQLQALSAETTGFMLKTNRLRTGGVIKSVYYRVRNGNGNIALSATLKCFDGFSTRIVESLWSIRWRIVFDYTVRDWRMHDAGEVVAVSWLAWRGTKQPSTRWEARARKILLLKDNDIV